MLVCLRYRRSRHIKLLWSGLNPGVFSWLLLWPCGVTCASWWWQRRGAMLQCVNGTAPLGVPPTGMWHRRVLPCPSLLVTVTLSCLGVFPPMDLHRARHSWRHDMRWCTRCWPHSIQRRRVAAHRENSGLRCMPFFTFDVVVVMVCEPLDLEGCWLSSHGV